MDLLILFLPSHYSPPFKSHQSIPVSRRSNLPITLSSHYSFCKYAFICCVLILRIHIGFHYRHIVWLIDVGLGHTSIYILFRVLLPSPCHPCNKSLNLQVLCSKKHELRRFPAVCWPWLTESALKSLTITNQGRLVTNWHLLWSSMRYFPPYKFECLHRHFPYNRDGWNWLRKKELLVVNIVRLSEV